MSPALSHRAATARRWALPRPATSLSSRCSTGTTSGWVSDWTAAIEHILELHVAGRRRAHRCHQHELRNRLALQRRVRQRLRAVLCGVRARHESWVSASSRPPRNHGAVGQLPAPACFSVVTSVGSVAETTPLRVSEFANRSTHIDLLAPGEVIESAAPGDHVAAYSGTSQAAPHVAAVWALLRSRDAELSPDTVVAALRATGTRVSDPVIDATLPVVHAARAVEILAVPPVAELECTIAENTLAVSWEQADGAAHYEVEVTRDGVEVWRSALDSTASGLLYTVNETGELQVTVRAFNSSGFPSADTTCTVQVSNEATFVRGNCDATSRIDISDAVFLLNYLFLAGASPSCLEACNVNGDSDLNIADAMFGMNYLFLGGDAPPAPFPDCGPRGAHHGEFPCLAAC